MVDDADVRAAYPEWPVEFLDAGDPRVPARWRELAAAPAAGVRCAAALAWWEQDLNELLPAFAAVLAERLADVRVGWTRDGPVCVYAVPDRYDRPVCWAGGPPHADGPWPPFADRIPLAARRFLTTVHGGFVSPDGAHGLMPPRWMETLAEYAHAPEGIDGWLDGWDDDDRIDSRRLLLVAADSGLLHYCVSPDLPVGQVALVYEGDIDPQPFWSRLDELMVSALDTPPPPEDPAVAEARRRELERLLTDRPVARRAVFRESPPS